MGAKAYSRRYTSVNRCRKCSKYKTHSHIKGFCNKRNKFVKEDKKGCKLFEGGQ